MTDTAAGSCDVIVRGAMVMDGAGGPAFAADVGVAAGRIVAVGDLGASVAPVDMDATGRAVAPGFIDVHTHDDAALLAVPDMTPKLSQGVTTVIVGNCGFSLAPLTPRARLPQEFRVLDVDEGFRYPSMAGYVEALARCPSAVNAALLVGHTSLRVGAMSDWRRPARDHEIRQMLQALQEGLDAGALGLSSGLEYAPGAAAPTEEVLNLAGLLAPAGGIYVTHTRDYMQDLDGAMQEAFRIGRDAGVPVVLSHHQGFGVRHYGHAARTLGLIDEARRAQRVALDAYPYTAGATAILPDLVQAVERTVVTWSEPHPECAGRELAEIAAGWGVDQREAARRLAPGGAIYHSLHEDDVRAVLAHPHTMIGSDGIFATGHVHPRLWGTFARVLGHYSRDLGLFPMEEAVRRMTGLPALTYGLHERGFVRPGLAADLVIFDPARILDRATFESPARPSAGVDCVLVNGVVAWRDGAVTGERAGRVLRRRGAPD